jgi:Arc-like DNA binding domain
MKQKRKPGAGRKPAGPFAHNTAQLSIRMPDDLRAELERSANKKGRSLSQELLWRLRSSYRTEREQERRPPASRAISFLISELAERIGSFHLSEWHRYPLVFRAFRLAAAKVLEALEPRTGDPALTLNPFALIAEADRQVFADETLPAHDTPESFADFVANGLIHDLLHGRPQMQAALRNMRNDPAPELRDLAAAVLDMLYGVEDARRDLEIRVFGPDSRLRSGGKKENRNVDP